MDEKIFNYSKECTEKWYKVNKISGLIALVLFNIIIVAMLFVKGHNMPPCNVLLGVLIVVNILYVLSSIWFTKKTLFKKILENKLKISDEYIEHYLRNSPQRINFNDLKSLIIIRRPSNTLESILLKAKTGQMGILNFENMEEIATIIQGRLNKGVKLITRKRLWNWNSPLGTQLTSVFTLMAVIFGLDLVKANFGRQAYYFLSGAVLLIFGLSFLIFRPCSKYSGRRGRTIEIIFGIPALILGSSFVLIAFSMWR